MNDQTRHNLDRNIQKLLRHAPQPDASVTGDQPREVTRMASRTLRLILADCSVRGGPSRRGGREIRTRL